MRRKMITFITVLACAMLIMKLNINATSGDCASTPGGTTPLTVKWIKIDYFASSNVLPAYMGGINSYILNALWIDPWKNFSRILPYNNPLCIPCNPPSARFGYIDFVIGASSYTSKHTLKIDYGNPVNSKFSSTQTAGTSITGNHIRFLANGEIDIVVPSNITYIFTATIKSPCGLSGGCDYQNPNNIYVFSNNGYGIGVANASTISSLPFDLSFKTSTYSKTYGDCTIDY